jgi:methionine synthase / methylenetetrahydrofolate reductase(NADPH)
MTNKIVSLLAEGRPLLADGAMATSLYERGFYINRSFEELNVTDASAVRETTKAFLRAGSVIFHTNTFNATPTKLQQNGLQDQLESILQKAVTVCREAVGPDAAVMGLLGPLGVLVEPLGPTSVEEAQEQFTTIVRILEKTDIDGFSLNAIHDLNEMKAALLALRQHSSKPLFVAMGVHDNLRSSHGFSLRDFVTLAEEFTPAAIGLCGEVGPSGMLTALEKLRGLTDKPIYVLPNAGLPKYVNDQYIYLCSPDYFGKYAKRFVQAGANIIGGHCGVYESHIKAASNALRMVAGVATLEDGGPAINAIGRSARLPEHIQPIQDQPRQAVPLPERSQLGADLAAGRKVITVELVPPTLGNFPNFLKRCEELQAAGIRYVNIPDGARAMARVSSLQLAAYVRNKFKLEPIPHFTSRDRNLIGLQSDLLGAHIAGVHNVLLVTGDPPKLGNNPGATAVYDVDAIGLTHIVSRLNRGLDLGGTQSDNVARFTCGVAVNPTAANRELELKRFRYKIEAGADFAITQPIYNLETYVSFFKELGPCPIPIIMGIWPLVSLRNAEFLKNEVPGVDVPDWAVEEMRKAGDSKDEALRRGLLIAQKTMREASSLVAGFQVSAPFNRADVAIEAINGAIRGSSVRL